jgi:hypothetical protein
MPLDENHLALSEGRLSLRVEDVEKALSEAIERKKSAPKGQAALIRFPEVGTLRWTRALVTRPKLDAA